MTKLKSILNQIPWWLVSRAGIAGLAWWLLPFWMFFVVANSLYWASWFHAKTFMVPLLITLILSVVSLPSLWAAALIGIMFFLMLGAKELTFIHRVRAYELLGVMLLFLGALQMAMITEGAKQIYIPLEYFVPGIIFFILRESVSRYEQMQGEGSAEERRRSLLRSAVGGLVLWGYGSGLSGLPLEQIPKSAALFGGAVALFFLSARRTQEDVLYVRTCAGLALGVLILVFFATSWTL